MRRLAVALGLLVSAGTLGCNRSNTEEHAAPAAASPSASPNAVSLPGSSPLPGDWTPPAFQGSVYDLSLTLTGQDGKPTPLDVFRGHPVIITMFYGSCPNACPLLTTDIKRLDGRLSAAAHDRIRVLMVSFDAARDTPAKLTRFMEEHGLDSTRWRLASTPEDSARDLAAVLGIRYRKLDDGEFFHSSAIILLDENGKPIARVEGIGRDPAPILAQLR